MSLFRRDEPSPARPADRPAPAPPRAEPAAAPAARPAPPEARGAETRIGRGLRIEGRVLGSGPLTVEGTVEGEVQVDGRVVVAAGGAVRGRVHAAAVVVEGRVEGDVVATDRAEVAASGATEGDIEAPRVVIAEGAFFKGNVTMGGRAGQRPAGRAADGGERT